MTEKKVKTKRKVLTQVDRCKLIELYTFINNEGMRKNPISLMDFIKRKNELEECQLFFETIMGFLVDIINENATIKLELNRGLSPIKVDASELIKKIGGYDE